MLILRFSMSSRYANGDIYEGYMLNGMRHGYGLLRSNVGAGTEMYFGGWQSGMRSGYGVSTNNS